MISESVSYTFQYHLMMFNRVRIHRYDVTTDYSIFLIYEFTNQLTKILQRGGPGGQKQQGESNIFNIP